MSTYYLDYEGGSDAADGTTFANRWKTFTSGATAARIAPGDTVRIMGSPAPTSLGVNGTWTDSLSTGIPNGYKAATSLTNASPIAVTSTGHGFSTGDYVFIQGDATNTNANGVWKITVTSSSVFTLDGSTGNGAGTDANIWPFTNSVVSLASAVTKNIASIGSIGQGRTAWTASANVTCTINTTGSNYWRESHAADIITIASGFTTGKAAYKALGSAVDFSGYKQVSFFIKQSAGTLLATGGITLRLCSDTAGATTVNTIAVPALGRTQAWHTITVDTGGALGSSIQSIALYVATDVGAQTFYISDIIACKDSTSADSLTLDSLIGKNTGTETWYSILGINGSDVYIETNPDNGPTTSSGYSGTTETVTTYKREPIKTAYAAANNTAIHTIQDSGTSGSPITFDGGWNRTDMSTQDGETWFSGGNGNGNGIDIVSKNYVTLNKISTVKYYRGYSIAAGSNITFTNFSSNCNQDIGISVAGVVSNLTMSNLSANNNAFLGISLGALTQGTTINSLYALNNNSKLTSSSAGIQMYSSGTVIDSIGSVSNNYIGIWYQQGGNNVIKSVTSIKSSGSYGIYSYFGAVDNIIYSCGTISGSGFYAINNQASSKLTIYNVITSGSVLGAVQIGGGDIYLRNADIGEATEFVYLANGSGNGASVFSENHDATTDNHYIYKVNGVISSNASTRHTASGISWKMSPTSLVANQSSPLSLSIAKIACTANNLVTVKAWMYRDNTGLTMSLFCAGGQLAGVTSDVTSSMTVGASTWEELTITFTPTEAGVIEILATAYGGTSYNGYVDDMTITQA